MSRIKPMYDGVKLLVAITSDNHIDVNTKTNSKRIKTVKKVLKDTERSAYPIDAYITVGDTTSRGINENWDKVAECFDGRTPAKQVIFTLGNHDTWDENGYKGCENALKNYRKYMKKICAQDITEPYFSRLINGYRFIFLGSTSVAKDEDCAVLGEAQLEWLKNELDAADGSGKPIFIFCHQSINQHHGLPKTWDEHEQDWAAEVGGIGDESDEVKNIIEKYKNVYYFSGHSHMGLCGENSLKENGYASFETHNGVNYINSPCLTRPNHHGETGETGIGYLLEVYADKVVIRPRSFTKRKMNKKIIIKDGKPYFESAIK